MALVLAVGLVAIPALAADYDSGDKITTTGENTLAWTGQGATNGELNDVECDAVNYPDGYLLWILTSDGGTDQFIAGQTPYLVLNDDAAHPYYAAQDAGSQFHFFTPYFTPDSSLTAVAYFNTTDTGNSPQGAQHILTISHGCSGGGGGGPEEAVTVTKTAVTSYIRTYNWSIDKSVDTENGYTEDGYPKIWLYTDGSGDEAGNWTVDVTYDGYDDSGFNVSGNITITNSGDYGNATINDVEDLLAGTSIDVQWVDEFGEPITVDFPYTLEEGEALFGTYSEDVASKIGGNNTVTVDFEVEVGGVPTAFEASDYVDLSWGDPTTEVNKTVTIKDLSDLFGEVELGTVTAPNNAQFSYTKDFAWADYGEEGCGDYTYDNTAQVIGDDEVVLDSASATLLVNVQCFIYETAYAKEDTGAVCFIPAFDNWGWTNPVTGDGTYIWNLWAGAGQCDTSKGTLVGNVTVVRSGGYITVTYNMASGYLLKETHVYAGCTQFPLVKQGNQWVSTVAPGKYYNASPVACTKAYVIAHAKVGIPDPNFGP
jgi:hypothetical protein